MPLIAQATVLPAEGMLSADRPVMVDALFYEGKPYGHGGGKPEAFEPPQFIHELRGHAEPVPPHNHELYEISIVCGGSATHITEDYEKPVGPGNAIIVSPYEVHAFEDVSDLVVINICYLTEWLGEAITSLWETPSLVQLFLANDLFDVPTLQIIPQLELPEDTFEVCLGELNTLARELETTAPSRLFLRLCLMKVLVLLSRTYTESFSVSELHHRFRPQVWYVLEEVEECITRGEPPDLARFADLCHFSRDYLTHVFKEATGLSIREYHQKRRAQRAASLLLRPGNSVTKVAYELAYADASHLSRLFQRYYGETPKQFQKRYVLSRRPEPSNK